MAMDKYSAVLVSHSSINDYLCCPRLYFLKNVYKDPKTGRKIQVAATALTLGQAVHGALEPLSNLPTNERFKEPLLARYDAVWEKHTGKKGGFSSPDEEARVKEKGKVMLQNVIADPGPLKNLSVKIKEDLPNYWLSETEGLILCGKIDWLEYVPETDGVHIIDFKTSKKQENEDSLQLPIYLLLVTNTQKRKVTKASYWYLNLPDGMVEKELPDMEKANADVLKVAREIALIRKLQKYDCRDGGCRYCEPFEKVLKGEAEFLGEDEFHRDLYYIPRAAVLGDEEEESIIL